jgi:RHS repeat-associated protein
LPPIRCDIAICATHEWHCNRSLYDDAIDMVLADKQHASNAGAAANGTTASGLVGLNLWTVSDHLNSVRDVVDNNGVVRRHVDYSRWGQRLSDVARDASGNVISTSSPSAIDELFGYTGRDWDADTQLQYNRARWYDPAQGRWLDI